jgi:hypothetical protein
MLPGACSSETPGPADCPPPHATFLLTVHAADGPLPRDVTIDVTFGAGEEQFDARHPDDDLKSVFCRLQQHDPASDAGDASASDAGDAPASDAGDASASDGGDHDAGAGGPLGSVVCELWTDGPATVRVEASGYPETERELSPERDRCGLMLTEETIVLERGD